MKICFLIGDFVPHQILSIKTLTEKYNAEVLVFYVGRYVTETPKGLKNTSIFQYKSMSKTEILGKIKSYNPHIVITAGWMIPEYNWICKRLRKSFDFPIVAMSDTPWYGTIKQIINVGLSPLHLKKAFTHLWVAGIRQYDYARKLGFSNEQIIFNSLSADNFIFNQVDIEIKKTIYPKNFIYIGRYTEIKGLRNLAEAWSSIDDKKGWTFTLVGAGEMYKELQEYDNFIIKNYMNQDLLLQEMQNAGCFVLPSLKEPWALVIHEAAIAGLPIICTETCGAAAHFVINGYNGYRINDNDIMDLKAKMELIINRTQEELVEFSNCSRKLSQFITPEIQTASIMQLLYEKN